MTPSSSPARQKRPVYVFISDEAVQIKSAADLWGKTTGETHRPLIDREGSGDILEQADAISGELIAEKYKKKNIALLGGIQSFSPVLLIFTVVLGVTVLKIFLASNTVTGIIITPILISLALSFGIHPWILVAPAAFTSSLGIILITQTTTNIISYTSGYFSLIDFAKAGVLMSIIIAILITTVIAIIGPLTGIYAY
jgi:hypothetical protein